ncbi:hypothetical protein [Desulfurella sp.]|uniref:hypothetical protein n=1 Tax=Desulfurella sp. TaxID=1962857 RepID=UPI0025C459C6|nr:hypothetical protein [Desulfurella sp.]
MYISEQLIKKFLDDELKDHTLWVARASEIEKKLSMDLGSHDLQTKRRPFIILKTKDKTNIACVAFFSSKQFYKNQVSFSIPGNCEKRCRFHFFDISYIYRLKNKEVFPISKDIFDFKLVEYCGICNNIDYLCAKLKKQVENCK